MTLSLPLIAACLLSIPAVAQGQLAGIWHGHWIRMGDSLPVTLTVRFDSTTRGYAASFDSDRLRVMGIPYNDVALTGCCTVVMRLVGDRTTSVFTGTLRGDSLTGDIREGQVDGRFAFGRARSALPPIAEREVTFRNGDVTLAGSLLLPAARTRHPAVVFVHGSGAEGRWASRFLAMAFARNGVASLIFDKRGVGKSTGDWRSASLGDLAGDAAAGVAFLAGEPQIDARRIGIHGHSQGGTLAPMIAVRAKTAFVVASAASGVPTDSTEIFSILNSILPNAATSADSANARAYVSELVAVAYHGRARTRLDELSARFQGQRWYFAPPAPDAGYWTFSREFAQFDALSWWRQVRVPVLLIAGANDQRLPAAESAARIAAEMLRQSRSADLTVRVLPDADHTFRLPPGPSGWPRTAPGYLETLIGWITAR